MIHRNSQITFNDGFQVRLVHDLEVSLTWYRDVLGCQVDYWGHAIRGGLKLILQQANHMEDVKPNLPSAKRNNYPTEWEGPDLGWDTFIHVSNDQFDQLEHELKENGATILLGPIEATHSNGMKFINIYIQDPDGYTIVFG